MPPDTKFSDTGQEPKPLVRRNKIVFPTCDNLSHLGKRLTPLEFGHI